MPSPSRFGTDKKPGVGADSFGHCGPPRVTRRSATMGWEVRPDLAHHAPRGRRRHTVSFLGDSPRARPSRRGGRGPVAVADREDAEHAGTGRRQRRRRITPRCVPTPLSTPRPRSRVKRSPTPGPKNPAGLPTRCVRHPRPSPGEPTEFPQTEFPQTDEEIVGERRQRMPWLAAAAVIVVVAMVAVLGRHPPRPSSPRDAAGLVWRCRRSVGVAAGPLRGFAEHRRLEQLPRRRHHPQRQE